MFNKKFLKFNFILFFLICAFVVKDAGAASRQGNVKNGTKSFHDGKYEDAIKSYQSALAKDEESDIINFNLGTTYFKNGDYEKAVEHLNKTLLSESSELKQKAYYNLGDVNYKYGIGFESKDIQKAISELNSSLKNFKQAIDLDGKDIDAKNNFEFVKKELERLKLKQEQQRQDKTCDNKSQQQNKDQENDQSSKNEQKDSKDKQSQDNQEEQKKQDQEKDQASKNDQQENKDKQDQSNQEEQQQKQKNDNASDADNQQQPGSDRNDEKNQDQNKNVQYNDQVNKDELTQKEAEMKLEKYEQNDQPKGLLRFYKGSSKNNPIEKDW